MASERKGYSFQTGHRNSFGGVDYVIFVSTLLVSAVIGVFYAIKDRKKKNIKDFLMAGGNMNVIPVSMSLLATFMSAVTLLGTPAEIYNYSTMYLWIALGYVICIFLSAHIFIPVFYNLKLTSAYEYLEKRFSKGVRVVGTCAFSLQMMIYMALVLYGPSLALNAVTGISLWGAVVAIGIVCTFYTSLGGMKAVLWTDTFQVGMMVAGVTAALIQGSIQMGGFRVAWEIAANNSRVDFADFRPDLNVRHSFWALTIGGAVLWTSVYGTNQAQVQRALTCGSLRDAQIALWLNVPGLWIILGLCSMVGIVMYAFYSTCDPITFGLIFASDQLFPLFVMDVLGHVPGLPGLFVAGIFSGSLSTMSSGLNSMAVVILQDLIRPYCLEGMSETRATMWSRVLAIIFGGICLGFTWLASKLGGLLQAALSLFGILGCPMLGLFTLGIFFPWANKWGAYVGLFSSLAVMFWIGVGSHIAQIPVKHNSFSTMGCNWSVNNRFLLSVNENGENKTVVIWGKVDSLTTATTSLLNITHSGSATDVSGIYTLYELSYLWYSILSVSIVIVVGLIVSLITGCQDPKQLDPRLVQPVCNIMCPYCPRWLLEYFHCGVQHHRREDWDERDEGKLDPKSRIAVFAKDDILFQDAESTRLHPASSIEMLNDLHLTA